MAKTNSPDLMQEEIKKLWDVFPQFVSEWKIDIGWLQAYFQNEIAEWERYTMNRHGKSRAKLIAREPSTATLRPDLSQSKDRETTGNLLIEWDNLEVLKLLQNHYYEQIKCIYIDPPYNKDKDFVYSDTRKDALGNYLRITGQQDDEGQTTTAWETIGRKHSNWLSMMYPRLYLARKLLRDDGVIFVSIDDDEVHNLRKLMDEIFGEGNFVACITVVGNPRGRDYGGVAKMHDYILVYLKSEESIINDLNDPNKEFPFKDEKGDFEIRELRNRNIAFNSNNRPNLYYPFYINPNKRDKDGFFEIALENHKGWVELYPKESQGYNTVWRWGKAKSLENLNIEIVWKEMEDGGFQIIEKYRKTTRMARSVWSDKEDNTEKGTLLIKSLFKNKVFDFPKPMEMIRKIIEMWSNQDSNDIILDFFAWSWTTGHAVMDLNAEDGGNRQYILVQLPELIDEKQEAYKAWYRKISEITRDRLLKAGEKIAKWDVWFRFLSLATSNFQGLDPISIKEWETTEQQLFDRVALEYDAFGIKKDRSDEDIIYELLIRYGYSLHSKVEHNTPFSWWYTITDDTNTERHFFLSLEDTLSKDVVADFVKTYHTNNAIIFVCKDDAISAGDRITLAQYFPWFTTI